MTIVELTYALGQNINEPAINDVDRAALQVRFEVYGILYKCLGHTKLPMDHIRQSSDRFIHRLAKYAAQDEAQKQNQVAQLQLNQIRDCLNQVETSIRNADPTAARGFDLSALKDMATALAANIQEEKDKPTETTTQEAGERSPGGRERPDRRSLYHLQRTQLLG